MLRSLRGQIVPQSSVERGSHRITAHRDCDWRYLHVHDVTEWTGNVPSYYNQGDGWALAVYLVIKICHVDRSVLTLEGAALRGTLSLDQVGTVSLSVALGVIMAPKQTSTKSGDTDCAADPEYERHDYRGSGQHRNDQWHDGGVCDQATETPIGEVLRHVARLGW
jgi:hypothetical protein